MLPLPFPIKWHKSLFSSPWWPFSNTCPTPQHPTSRFVTRISTTENRRLPRKITQRRKLMLLCATFRNVSRMSNWFHFGMDWLCCPSTLPSFAILIIRPSTHFTQEDLLSSPKTVKENEDDKRGSKEVEERLLRWSQWTKFAFGIPIRIGTSVHVHWRTLGSLRSSF